MWREGEGFTGRGKGRVGGPWGRGEGRMGKLEASLEVGGL